MSNVADDLIKQAQSGNIVVILKILKQQLGERGVQTRGIFTDGVLQLLCEAPRPEQLEPSFIITRVRDILDSLSPRFIRRVRINSRIFQQQQQLLWFEEINRNSNHQLLWSEEIILKKPSFFQEFIELIQDSQAYTQTWQFSRQNSTDYLHEKQPFNRGLVGGMVVSLVALILGFSVYQWLNSQTSTPVETPQTATATPTPLPENQPSDTEIFAQAVRLAQEAVTAGEVAQTRQEWLEIAEKWKEAANLMEAVSADFSRHATAQNRAALYRRNQEVAVEESLRWRD